MSDQTNAVQVDIGTRNYFSYLFIILLLVFMLNSVFLPYLCKKSEFMISTVLSGRLTYFIFYG